MSSTSHAYYQLSDMPDRITDCFTDGPTCQAHGPRMCLACDPAAPLVLLPVQAKQDRAKPGTPRLSTLQRELDRLNKRYRQGRDHGKNRRITEKKIRLVTAAIAAHPKGGKHD